MQTQDNIQKQKITVGLICNWTKTWFIAIKCTWFGKYKPARKDWKEYKYKKFWDNGIDKGWAGLS